MGRRNIRCARRARRFSLTAAFFWNEKGKRILSAFAPKKNGARFFVAFLRQRGWTEHHAARKKAPRTRKQVQRGQRSAARRAQNAARAQKSACQRVGDADGGLRIDAPARRVPCEQ